MKRSNNSLCPLVSKNSLKMKYPNTVYSISSQPSDLINLWKRPKLFLKGAPLKAVATYRQRGTLLHLDNYFYTASFQNGVLHQPLISVYLGIMPCSVLNGSSSFMFLPSGCLSKVRSSFSHALIMSSSSSSSLSLCFLFFPLLKIKITQIKSKFFKTSDLDKSKRSPVRIPWDREVSRSLMFWIIDTVPILLVGFLNLICT